MGIDPLVHSTHYTGAASEHLAAVWFLRRGHQVFWPACQQGSIDFVAQYEGKLQRVQVKTATWGRAGDNRYLQCRTRLTNRHQDYHPSDLYDLLVVVHDLDFWIIPAGEVDSSNISLRGTNPKYKETRWEKYVSSLTPPTPSPQTF